MPKSSPRKQLSTADLVVLSLIAEGERDWVRWWFFGGLGSALVNAVLAKDYPTIQGLTLVIGAAVVLINLIVDMILAALDPTSMAPR